MKTSDLKIITMFEIAELDLTKKEKISLLELVKEMDIYQCMGFIMDKKIYNLNEKGKEEIKKRFFLESEEKENDEEENDDEETVVDEMFPINPVNPVKSTINIGNKVASNTKRLINKAPAAMKRLAS